MRLAYFTMWGGGCQELFNSNLEEILHISTENSVNKFRFVGMFHICNNAVIPTKRSAWRDLRIYGRFIRYLVRRSLDSACAPLGMTTLFEVGNSSINRNFMLCKNKMKKEQKMLDKIHLPVYNGSCVRTISSAG